MVSSLDFSLFLEAFVVTNLDAVFFFPTVYAGNSPKRMRPLTKSSETHKSGISFYFTLAHWSTWYHTRA
jgi:hypothetical protein